MMRPFAVPVGNGILVYKHLGTYDLQQSPMACNNCLSSSCCCCFFFSLPADESLADLAPSSEAMIGGAF